MKDSITPSQASIEVTRQKMISAKEANAFLARKPEPVPAVFYAIAFVACVFIVAMGAAAYAIGVMALGAWL